VPAASSQAARNPTRRAREPPAMQLQLAILHSYQRIHKYRQHGIQRSGSLLPACADGPTLRKQNDRDPRPLAWTGGSEPAKAKVR
jgi:hypothetical protein